MKQTVLGQRIGPALAVAALVIGLTGCPPSSFVWIAEGSSAEDLVFIRGEELGDEDSLSFSGLRVYHCDPGDYPRGIVWRFDVDSGQGTPEFPSRVRYGVVPAGFSESVMAQPLTPGCYGATASGTATVEFEVDSSGSVRQLRVTP